MTIYTIENESNHIIRHVLQQDADVVTGAERFSSEADLATIAASWPTARLVEIWNQLPGVTPVRKFTDRKTAISRIWNALSATEVAVPAQAEPEIEAVPVAEVAQEPEPVVEPEASPEEPPTTTPEAQQPPDVAPVVAEGDQEDHPAEENAHGGQQRQRFPRGQ